MDIEKGDYQTGTETIDTEENSDYIYPFHRKTRQTWIPLGKKKRDHRSNMNRSQPRDTNINNPESYTGTPSTTHNKSQEIK
jgi:hypothetical protein